MGKSMFSTRLPADAVQAIQRHAELNKQSQSEALVDLLDRALDVRGREGLETRLAAAEAKIIEQERIVRRHTGGRGTPNVKRVSLGVTLAEAAALDRAALDAGMTRAEFLRARVFGDGRRPALPSTTRPALPAPQAVLPA